MKTVSIIFLSFLLLACGGSSNDDTSTSDELNNTAPNADAGSDQSIALGNTISLDASNSNDADGDTLTFSWSLTTQPTNSTSTLSNYDSATISFTPDIIGTYIFTLSVSDGSETATDTVQVSVVSVSPDTIETPAVTIGEGNTVVSNLFSQGSRVAATGEITDNDGVLWAVPADVNFSDISFPLASDLYNPYNSGNSFSTDSEAVSALSSSNIVEIDESGELITAYIFADNYFEMYINGIPTGKDPVPFTQFNSNIVQFRVDVPFQVAMLLVDWEENLGTGTELNGSSQYHPGDGGMVAVFKNEDGNIIGVTDGTWKAKATYIAPISDTSCLQNSNNERDSSLCSTEAPTELTNIMGLHWAQDANWFTESFDDSDWPLASTFTNDTVGVDNKPSYTNFTNIFDDTSADAQFIWSNNIVLDNEVLVRKTIGDTTNVSSSLCDVEMVDSATVLSCSGDSLVVESKGRVDESYYPMMVGIKEGGWNGQYPAAQPYTGNNAFILPLSPTLADEPTIQIKNAVGMAVNGIPIFFPQTPGATGGASCVLETGSEGCLRDAIEDGEMDNCGGHSGRGNDYHYHQLTNTNGCLIDIVESEFGANTPVGIMYDGYLIYPRVLDGSSQYDYTYQDALDGSVNSDLLYIYTDKISLTDSCGGYISSDGTPYYAATDDFPYITNCMIGEFDASSPVTTQGASSDTSTTSGAITNYYTETQTDGGLCHYLVFGGGQTTEFCE
ncbi:YHYH protein [Pseudoalteromonas phenolica]|uniref:Signal peptide protein n=1 Tax=Pseudoalteromonas phenolica TaxID=161398 RepID=A0A0S2K6F7_9GAMM|nr:YHYH protein [Pseudoalteromonas phenolica]ALO43768.1 signal peptide protein [Pseudoalteromonas phenolica]MBE0355058.1 hypothetical protein [Pseudoalteromonas phenolica O-BC30]